MRAIGDRNLGACDVRVERPDHRQDRGVGDEGLDVLQAAGCVTRRADGIISRIDRNSEPIERRVALDEEAHAVEGRHAGLTLGSGQGKVDADRDPPRRRRAAGFARTGRQGEQERDADGRERRR